MTLLLFETLFILPDLLALVDFALLGILDTLTYLLGHDGTNTVTLGNSGFHDPRRRDGGIALYAIAHETAKDTLRERRTVAAKKTAQLQCVGITKRGAHKPYNIALSLHT